MSGQERESCLFCPLFPSVTFKLPSHHPSLPYSCIVVSCLCMSSLVFSSLVLSCQIFYCRVFSCLVLSCLVLSCSRADAGARMAPSSTMETRMSSTLSLSAAASKLSVYNILVPVVTDGPLRAPASARERELHDHLDQLVYSCLVLSYLLTSCLMLS